jgi:diguanylate cyclase (GGDEF)-like protein
MRAGGGAVRRMIGVMQDVSDRRQQEEMVRFLAYHDALTGLPNRRLLDDRLKQALYRAQRREASVAVLLIDLDDFKQVNDSAGHRAGDAVLREVAMRLGGCVRKADTLSRHGGDEFVVMMADLSGDSDCQVVAEKIHRALAAEFRIDGKSYSLGASIGIAVFPEDGGDADALLRNADAAMYRAKQLGRNHYRFFSR